ncbi:PKD domain-containing protein, partial [Chloroflexota bacterium]
IQTVDNAGNSASKEDTFIVKHLPTVYAGTDAIIVEGDTFMGSGAFTDPDSDNWTATVDYGDGSGPQPLALNPDSSFNLNHLYCDDGTYTVSVTVTDDNGGAGSEKAVVNVTNVAPSIDAGPDQIVFSGAQVIVNAAFTDRGILDTHNAVIDWGDGAVEAGMLVEANGSGTVAGSHIYINFVGTRTITVTVTDSDGGTESVSLSVNVEPVPVQIKIGVGMSIKTVDELKLRKRNVLVTIYGSRDFDVREINFGTVTLEGASLHRRVSYRDSNADGSRDVLISFLIGDMNFNTGHKEATLFGKTLSGVIFMYPFTSARPVEDTPSNSFDTIINAHILKRALGDVEQYGGQCKTWVWRCVRGVSGRLLSTSSLLSYWPTRWLPSNQQSGDCWSESDWAIVVCQGTKWPSEYCRLIKSGQIMQLSHKGFGYVIPHTVIIEEATENGLWVIDSNWAVDGVVQRHFIDKSWLDTYLLGWTLYQIR